jgi:N-terminal half of MaoC dehydratase
MFDFPIERGKIREFAQAAQSTNPAYQGLEAIIPPTFLTIAGMAWEPPEESLLAGLGFDLPRILHGEEEYVFFGPLPKAGDTLLVMGRKGDEWEKEGQRGGVMRFAQLVREFRSPDGSLVAEQRMTIIETAAKEAK